MSGDSGYSIKELLEKSCPFCSGKITKMEVWVEVKAINKYLCIRCECSNPDCPAMGESGAFWVHIYENGEAHAYYY